MASGDSPTDERLKTFLFSQTFFLFAFYYNRPTCTAWPLRYLLRSYGAKQICLLLLDMKNRNHNIIDLQYVVVTVSETIGLQNGTYSFCRMLIGSHQWSI